ncbi:MAG: SDR family NAD(P)-dependent oxidoreductase, partial [Verrucomicrobiales bacterium]
MNPFSLENKVALVTGAGINIGRGIAEGLAKAGAQVAIGYRSHEDEAQALADQLGDQGFAVQLDVCSPDSIEAAMAQVEGHFGGLDILVNNAGIFSLSPQAELTAEEWDRIFQVNTRGLFLCSKAAAVAMQKRGGGAIINIASINGFHPGFGNTAHYDASKGAVIAYTRSLAAELASQKIRVNGIAPGLVDAPWLREQFADLATM